jgi:hypothetical protein
MRKILEGQGTRGHAQFGTRKQLQLKLQPRQQQLQSPQLCPESHPTEVLLLSQHTMLYKHTYTNLDAFNRS